MAARDKERYYWLKLPTDFFKRHDIKVIESMQNGKEYVLFYLKLMLESVDHEGTLRFSDFIPYNEEMLAAVTNTNVDTVRVAVSVLEQFGMLELWDDKTLYLKQVAELLGSETYAAKRKRAQREELPGEIVPRLSPECPQEIEIDIEKEIDIETDKEKEVEKEKSKRKRFEPPTVEDVIAYSKESNYPLDAQRFCDYYSSIGWMVGKNKMKDWKAAARNWSLRDHPKTKPQEQNRAFTPTEF